MIEINNYQEMVDYIKSQHPMEALGFVINNEFRPTKNIARDPVNEGRFLENAYLKASLEGIQAYVHSHTQDVRTDHLNRKLDPRTPSKQDMIAQEAMDVPFLIFYTDGNTITAPLEFGGEPAELLGRPYIANVYDCWTLARDYYQINYKIELPVFPREPDWIRNTPSLFNDKWEESGFVEISKSIIQPGDGIAFKLSQQEHIDHCGVYIGNEQFIHHLYGQLSQTSPLSRYRAFQNASVVRHKSLIK